MPLAMTIKKRDCRALFALRSIPLGMTREWRSAIHPTPLASYQEKE
ncbi:MAG: hypothetical protein MUO40_00520 [Anaerolineaceae bacterium]|nr:hypothetical protein [Anaerolineaceae bacterium]